MYRVSGNTIEMVRGDTLALRVRILVDGEEYAPAAGDRIRFAMKRRQMNAEKGDFIDEEPLILREIPIGTMILKLLPEDTKALPFGKYAYDIQITFADGYVDTFIPNARISLLPEVD